MPPDLLGLCGTRVRIQSIGSWKRASRYRRSGKAAIADVLLRAEEDDRLLEAPIGSDWYRYLFDLLAHRDLNNYKAQCAKLSIVTFNFDRSLERALFLMLHARFGFSREEAARLVPTANIHHVHGTLGDPEWLDSKAQRANPYEMRPSHELFHRAVANAASMIKNVHDEIDETTLEDLSVPLGKAECVYFIGFGFDERNVQRLGIPSVLQHSSKVVLRGTRLGLTDLELRPSSPLFANHPLHLYDIDALTFLKTRAEALFD